MTKTYSAPMLVIVDGKLTVSRDVPVTHPATTVEGEGGHSGSSR